MNIEISGKNHLPLSRRINCYGMTLQLMCTEITECNICIVWNFQWFMVVGAISKPETKVKTNFKFNCSLF